MTTDYRLQTTAKQKEKTVDGRRKTVDKSGFTLVELLVVIAILIVLATFGLVVYRDLSAQARDGTRISDITNVVDAVQLATHDAVDPALALCFGTTAPCQAASSPVSTSTSHTDGTGWVLVDFDTKNLASFNKLPVDPTNDAIYHYTYKSDGLNWEVSGPLESIKYRGKATQDGGNDDNLFEAGYGTRKI